MKNTIRFNFLIICIFFSVIGYGQDAGIAICIKDIGSTNGDSFREAFVEKAKDKPLINTALYHWEDNRLTYMDVENHPEIPYETAVFLNHRAIVSDYNRPEVKFKVDTNGIVTAAHFDIFYKIACSAKVVNIATGEVEKIIPEKSLALGKNVLDPKPLEIDVKKYFGKRKESQIRKSWSVYTRDLYIDYNEKIKQQRNRLENNRLKDVTSVKSTVGRAHLSGVYNVSKDPKEDGLFRSVSLDMSDLPKLEKDQLMYLYTPTKYGDFKAVEYVAAVMVKEVNEENAKAKKMFYQRKKKFSKKVEENDPLFAVSEMTRANDIIERKVEKTNLALEVDGYSKFDYEKRIMRLPAISLIERELDPELNQLRKLYKDERFIDYDLKDLQDRMEGVEYIMTVGKDNVNLTNVATGELVAVDQDEGRRNWFFSGYTMEQSVNLALMKISNEEIQLVEVTDEKKDKVKEIRLYHPLGFVAGDKMDISIVEAEEVAGKTFERKSYLTSGWIATSEDNPNFGTMKISRKQRKDLYNAIKDGKKLHFSYFIKRD